MNTITANHQTHTGAGSLFRSPTENRLRGGWRLLIQGAGYMGSSLLAQFILGAGMGIFMMASGADLTDPQVVIELSTRPVMRLLTALLSLGCILLTCWAAARWLDKRPFRAYGFELTRQWWLDMGFGLALGAFLMLVIFLVERLAGWIDVSTPALDGSAWGTIFVYLVVYICVGITEELFSRGYQIRNLAESTAGFNPRLAVLIAYLGTSIFFGLLHAANPNASMTSTVYLMIAGLFLGLGYVLTGQLGLSIGLHITWNFFEGSVFGFPVSGMGSAASLVQIEQGGPALWTGGPFGPEAGLVGLAATALGVLLILAYVKLTRGQVSLHTKLAEYTPAAE